MYILTFGGLWFAVHSVSPTKYHDVTRFVGQLRRSAGVPGVQYLVAAWAQIGRSMAAAMAQHGRSKEQGTANAR